MFLPAATATFRLTGAVVRRNLDLLLVKSMLLPTATTTFGSVSLLSLRFYKGNTFSLKQLNWPRRLETPKLRKLERTRGNSKNTRKRMIIRWSSKQSKHETPGLAPPMPRACILCGLGPPELLPGSSWASRFIETTREHSRKLEEAHDNKMKLESHKTRNPKTRAPNTPCMYMHGSTLVYIYIYIYIHIWEAWEGWGWPQRPQNGSQDTC